MTKHKNPPMPTQPTIDKVIPTITTANIPEDFINSNDTRTRLKIMVVIESDEYFRDMLYEYFESRRGLARPY